jgi:hypothetical protein
VRALHCGVEDEAALVVRVLQSTGGEALQQRPDPLARRAAGGQAPERAGALEQPVALQGALVDRVLEPKVPYSEARLMPSASVRSVIDVAS